MEFQCISNDTLFICPSIYNVFFRAYCSVEIKSLIKVLLIVLKHVLFFAISNAIICLFYVFSQHILFTTNGHLLQDTIEICIETYSSYAYMLWHLSGIRVVFGCA